MVQRENIQFLLYFELVCVGDLTYLHRRWVRPPIPSDTAPSIKAGEYKHRTQGGNNEKDSVDIPIACEIIANAVQQEG